MLSPWGSTLSGLLSMNQLTTKSLAGGTLLEEVNLGSARGGRKVPRPLELEVVRELTSDDLPVLQAPAPMGTSVPSIKAIRASHHRLAELVAKGTSGVEISAITGYSQSYISNIQRSPAFAELVDYYSTQCEQLYVDAMERLKVLGLSSVEELQARVDENPEKFSPRELMELVQLALIKPLEAKRPFAPSGATSGGSAPLVEIKFVGTAPGGAMVDVTPGRDR